MEKEFDEASSELRSLLLVAGDGEHSLTLDWVNAQRATLLQSQQEVRAQIESAERELYTAGAADKVSLNAQEEAYSTVQDLQARLIQAREERDALLLEIADF